ncbi:DUF4328 domain-containing protein [Pyxidicoccus fallax]|uniref:DUF4328 domain-containing protein n=1 Tax=Pyxidicoccus fallax TaxID=394095 RepID=A0A848LXZ8_9BACT|nr:DUF4328 domain-containing protein [Pyxidicoccus fallax]NMO22696.1 DUF4328 domain-containing protein [Pyxidicoccus fallax]NPC85258.1 DUF4328 domain-containing protein [Pyxidicoccus fallax]
MQPELAVPEPLPAAACAEHPDAPSQRTCPRCGRFACERCLLPTSEVCLDCQRRQLQALPSAAPRARWAERMLWVRAATAAASVMMDVWLHARLEDGFSSVEDATTYDTLAALVAVPTLLSMVLSAVFFLRWLRLSIQTAATMGLSQESISWATWCWFIPLANFIKPYEVVRDLRRNLGGPAGTGLLQGWWAAWVAMNILNRVSDMMSRRAEQDGAAFSSSLVAGIALELVVLVAAVLCIQVIRQVQVLLDDRVADFTRAPAEVRP